MGKTLATILGGFLILTGCQNLTPAGWDLAYGLTAHAGKEAISRKVNPSETNINVYNPPQGSYPQHSTQDSSSSKPKSEEEIDQIEALRQRKKMLEYLIDSVDKEDPIDRLVKLLEKDGTSREELQKVKDLQEKDKQRKKEIRSNMSKMKAEIVQIDEKIKVFSERKAEREVKYIFFFDDENKDNRANEDETQKASKRVKNLEDSLRTSSFRIGDNLLCQFHYKASENVEGKKISVSLFDEQRNLVSEKFYINTAENCYQGYVSIEAPKKMGKYTLEAYDEQKNLLLSHTLIINE